MRDASYASRRPGHRERDARPHQVAVTGTTSGAPPDATSAIAYAGEPGAFAEDAVIAAYGDVPRLPVGGFREVFEEVAGGKAAMGVVPIENLVNGSVREVYDLLLEHELTITGEVVVPVDLCLAALPGTSIDEVQRVYSHIQALGQGERFLRSRRWKLLTTYNTAGAGKFVVDQGDRAAAAVLSRRAAARFGLTVLAESIQDVPDNRTRFLILSAAETTQRGPDGVAPGAFRTTLAFGVRNEPGTLLQALGVFAERSINLSKLESRPSRGAAWEYVFWADLDAHRSDRNCAAAIAGLDAVATMVRVFGSYRRAPESAVVGATSTVG
jgi:prephenate dehydratase